MQLIFLTYHVDIQTSKLLTCPKTLNKSILLLDDVSNNYTMIGDQCRPYQTSHPVAAIRSTLSFFF